MTRDLLVRLLLSTLKIEDSFLFSATIGKKGSIKVTKDSDVGNELLKAIAGKKRVKVLA